MTWPKGCNASGNDKDQVVDVAQAVLTRSDFGVVMKLLYVAALLSVVSCAGDKDKRSGAEAPQENPESTDVPVTSDVVQEQTPVENTESNDDFIEDEQGPSKGDDGEDKGSCIEHVINFDYDPNGNALAVGERIESQYQAWGVHFEYDVYNQSKDWGITFDSANPTGGDDDLGIDVGKSGKDDFNGNILILAEDPELHGSGLVKDPDDNRDGGKFIIKFDQAVEVKRFTLIDNDNNKNEDQGKAILYSSSYIKGDEDSETKIKLPHTGNKDIAIVDDFAGMRGEKLIIKFPGSGAIDDLVICK
ncbi:hypothetical protein [Pseudobacteriovorax antillogorgiicola]|uniref:Uncharacterized protein n=1 Tax=Pseudobacteriovorax antillogorgiicola TaxID=1513793 RepID=A0A1Y6BSS7_9BACT|nr:hypothetical protein [Pseudobacteriovorax antillogorgiicola]TCS54698.1 hypothetical protein EDD56_106211 [Pseudobacteriovorax antillogorgiicola]SMF16359.1 hypothetical protein SAMN06296036_10632 [Pseudobacteriovorax antillogorgiicola]